MPVKFFLFFRGCHGDLLIVLCLIFCPIISLWSGISYIKERRKRRYVFRSRR
ncbi:small membrane protein [Klebsiella variicola]|nr:small membrane protein [Klebsiella variicola]ELA0569184.1 small membrane protein [Klebsiella variicola]MBD0697710.1 small membrane protein [Klebsiella variicola]MBD0749102.1 small membrane protein [Klebsiella variicola]MDP0707421.1 small membrane protein [Klebsiella variicola]